MGKNDTNFKNNYKYICERDQNNKKSNIKIGLPIQKYSIVDIIIIAK